MTEIEDVLGYVLFGMVILIALVLLVAVINDTRPQCWFSRAPFLCERIYILEGK